MRILELFDYATQEQGNVQQCIDKMQGRQPYKLRGRVKPALTFATYENVDTLLGLSKGLHYMTLMQVRACALDCQKLETITSLLSGVVEGTNPNQVPTVQDERNAPTHVIVNLSSAGLMNNAESGKQLLQFIHGQLQARFKDDRQRLFAVINDPQGRRDLYDAS